MFPHRGTGGRLLPRIQRKSNSRPHILFAADVYTVPVCLYNVFANGESETTTCRIPSSSFAGSEEPLKNPV
jgi:hypothetical protein